MAGRLPDSPTLVYDEDHYYMGGVIAEKLRAAGLEVVLATPSEVVSKWAEMTTERWLVRTRLMELGVDIVTSHSLSRFDGSTARLQCEFTGKSKEIGCSHVVMVTQRRPNDALYRDLLDSVDGNFEKLPFSLKRIGDCDAPAIVASAVYAGHRYARELDEMTDVDEPLRHDRVDTGAFSNHSAPPDGATRAEYLETLLLYYEEEIEGEVFFEELAKRFSDPARKEGTESLVEGGESYGECHAAIDRQTWPGSTERAGTSGEWSHPGRRDHLGLGCNDRQLEENISHLCQ